MNRELENRIQRLERSNRGLTVFCICLATFAGLGLVGWQPEQEQIPDLLKARSLEIVGADGKPRFVVKTLSDGPLMKMTDNDGESRFYVMATDYNTHVSVDGAARESSVRMDTHREGPQLYMLGENAKQRVMLAGTEMPALHLEGDKGIASLKIEHILPSLHVPQLFFFRGGNSVVFSLDEDKTAMVMEDVDGKKKELLPPPAAQ